MRSHRIFQFKLLIAITLTMCLAMTVNFTNGTLAAVPGKATPVSPMGTVYDDTPTYKWNAVSDSTWYYLWVDDSSGTPIKKWYRATDAGCGNGSGLCSITPNTALTLGSGEWWVQTWNSDGDGSWSKPLSFTLSANENLILNGDFEANSDPFSPDVPPNSWNVFQTHALGGWTVANTFPFSANFPPGLEIWDTWSGYPAANGTQHIELDGDDPTTILQRPATTESYCYELLYAWSPRPFCDDNQMKVYVNGMEVAYHIASGLGNSTTQWTWEAIYFQATNSSTLIAFTEVGLDDQLGMLLDAVSLKELKECPLIHVDIDIRPGRDPNSIDLKSKGKVPVAILTIEGFDANDVDPDTCVFANANLVRWKMKDVDKDRDDDMLFYFKIRELDLTKESTEATLECETLEGTQITGTDSVKIVNGNYDDDDDDDD